MTSELDVESRAAAARRGGDEAARGRRGRLLPARPRARRAPLRRRARLRPGRSSVSSSRRRTASPAWRCARRGRCRRTSYDGDRGARSASGVLRVRARARRADGLGGETRGVLGVGHPRRGARVRRRRRRAARGVRVRSPRSRSATPRASPSAHGRRGCSAASTGSRSLLGEPLSLRRDLDAAAQAAAEALGGDFAAVLDAGAGLSSSAGTTLPEPCGRSSLPQALLEAAARRADARRSRSSTTTSASTRAGARRRSHRCSRSPCAGDGAGIVLVLLPRAARLPARRPRARAAGRRRSARRARAEPALRGRASGARRYRSSSRARAACSRPSSTRSRCSRRSSSRRSSCSARMRPRSQLSKATSSSSTAALGDGAEARSARARRRPAGSAATSSSRGAPVAYDDVGRGRRPRRTDALLAGGHRAYLGVPLAAREGALHGVLAVYAAEPRRWREEEIAGAHRARRQRVGRALERRALPARRARARAERRDPREHRRRDRRRRSRRPRRAVERGGRGDHGRAGRRRRSGARPRRCCSATSSRRPAAPNRLVAIPRGGERRLALAVRSGDARPDAARSRAGSSRSATSRPSTSSSR